jgi:hypothetical protein
MFSEPSAFRTVVCLILGSSLAFVVINAVEDAYHYADNYVKQEKIKQLVEKSVAKNKKDIKK